MILFYSCNDVNVNHVCIFDANCCSLVLGVTVINHVSTFYQLCSKISTIHSKRIHNVPLTVD